MKKTRILTNEHKEGTNKRNVIFLKGEEKKTSKKETTNWTKKSVKYIVKDYSHDILKNLHINTNFVKWAKDVQ